MSQRQRYPRGFPSPECQTILEANKILLSKKNIKIKERIRKHNDGFVLTIAKEETDDKLSKDEIFSILRAKKQKKSKLQRLIYYISDNDLFSFSLLILLEVGI